MVFEINDYQTLKISLDSFCDFLKENDVPVDCIFDSKLVITELIGNILKYNQSQAKFCGEVKDGFVQLEIYTSNAYKIPDKTVCAGLFAEHGRGLFLVDKICEKRSQNNDGTIFIRIRIKED